MFLTRCVRNVMVFVVAFGLLLPGILALAEDDVTIVPSETKEQRDQRMTWWRDARFGLFIHWGVYSVPAGTWNGRKVEGVGEWIMRHAPISVADYAKLPSQFNPTKFDADAWVAVAKNAGMKYIVITAKHHDGFAMFPSKASPFNIHDATPFQRDPLKELAEACRKQGIKLGFYYSQAQDWHHPGGAAWNGHWDKAQDGDMTEYIRKIAVPQVREILSNYGPISILWWDTPNDMTKERADLLRPLLSLQPDIITNDRLGGGYTGDTSTPEQEIPATGLPGRDWETCMTMNDTWGYKSDDQNWKSTETLVRNLIDIASKGGNFLLNVGPTSEGLIPQPSIERLQAVGAWLKVNGEAIYGTSASPLKKLAWGRCTQKAGKLYLHVFDWPKGWLVVPELKNRVTGAYILADKERKPLDVTVKDGGVQIKLPDQAPDKIASVVVLQVAIDLPETLHKAAHVVPSPRQMAWQERELICFAHFGPNTFTDREWGVGSEDPKVFNPTAFDADQWVAACKAAGIRLLILTCKHHDGFCLWPSRYTDHSVKNSPWRDGKGDVVREVSDACRRGGIKFGIYLSPWDRHEKTYGSDAYNEYYKNQLRELLTNYGDIAEVWWDGACGEGPNGKRQVYDWDACTKIVRELQPGAVIFGEGHADLRWVGNEEGYARESEWSVLPRVLGDQIEKDLGSRQRLACIINLDLVWHPTECDVSIRPGWFYHPAEDQQVKSLEKLLDIYYSSVGRNAVLLLNIPPDRRGLFHENDVARLRELREVLDETFKKNLATCKPATATSQSPEHDASAAVDGRGDTCWMPADGAERPSLEIDLGQPQTFDRAMLQEMIVAGQRVERFALDAWDGHEWKPLAEATTIGYKRLLRFPPVMASKVRLTILESRDRPMIREVGLFKASPRDTLIQGKP